MSLLSARTLEWVAAGEPELLHDAAHVQRQLDEHVTAANDRRGDTARTAS